MKRALEKREIPRIGAAVTFLGFGALEIGRDWGLGDGRERQKPDDRQAEKVLHAVLDAGINLIDTASAYHRSEERIGKFLSSRRHEFILATKCGEHSKEPDTYYDFSYRAVKESIDRSLKQLQTDVIDIMQIHFGPDPERVIDEGETLAAMKDAQREGKIRYLGASIDGELATRLIESGEFDVMQMGYNLLDQTNEKNIALCREKGIGVFIRSGLAAGLLSARVLPHLNEQFKHKKKVLALLELVGGNGDQLTALALQFLYRNPGISSILVGSKRPERIGQNIALLQQEISDHLLEKALEIVND
ncbi:MULTISPECIES: aldo/keto reductase [unclassified Thermoactinomyces]|jgi:aryl-alcohol dehydrogenase-like predicted oxidoreductase|uniref:aldo/keto reductase n=1 Tax=unclassified Thermoactinomyces TaxID=2634588 RepID=UPI0018DE25B3|nr:MULTISPECIES: aldo/keto reductase [unclassified Thermoactinomyces]MBH8598902.1 aldo/keto reductase [Thermoactinomyces sp. CICC 10523]MBH8604887.1 aldo/keto reductase [Thermoactinomyces sp. CICC 10522]MBH8608397.1 aldo/keto reductase [Thermoactinomyces sp. CICC 10521]